MSFLGTTGTPALEFWWHLLWGSKAEWVLPYSLFAEVNVMYIPWDPPLVLHLLTTWWPAHSRSCPHILLQRWGCRDLNSCCSQNIFTNWGKPGPVTFLKGFKSEQVLPYSILTYTNVMYISQNPPLVLYLPISWWPGNHPNRRWTLYHCALQGPVNVDCI